ncbi:MAG: circularly permuted type 2 ATP-grasp protein [Planctomycetaceae bacterium]|nr:circularly permuted type 2 ATP-grasp protein [Planctomycetaceae bacterium]
MIRNDNPNLKFRRLSSSDTSDPGISDETWSRIDAAFRERLEAVELFLADLSGRFRFQSEIAADSSIAAVMEAERQHLHGYLPSFQRRVWLGSADLVCDSRGDFWFADDHYCCPFGLYRYSQLLSDASAASSANYAFANFQRSVREDLQRKLPDGQQAVVLGSGTFNTVYRENRFFAEFLGIPFATQQRLQMEQGRLGYLSGQSTQPVALVIRRLQDEDLDSSCYRTDSMQGVLGIVRAAQRGMVRVLNAPGTGLFNRRMITSLIPSMIRYYLGTEPLLPTVPTVPASPIGLMQAEQSPDDYIFRTDNSMDVMKPLVGRTCTPEEKARYLRRISANPESFVVRSTIAAATGGDAEARYALRIFAGGTSRRSVLRGGIRRDCATDGTPTAPVTQDPTAGCEHVAEAVAGVRPHPPRSL